MKNKLAIVIPAYKIDYFGLALESIINQTCLDFNLYIGNDASEADLESIIEKYSKRFPINYKRFDINFGGKDLVSHWERCIEMTGDEEWIWLFSDDDFMDRDCVYNFYKALKENPSFDLFHFDVIQVDQNNQVLKEEPKFPNVLSVKEFISNRLNRTIMSLVVEYVFRKEKYIQQGKFQKFDLAWGSDDATWIKIGCDKGIKNIYNSKVFWRRSTLNISCNINKEVSFRKYKARINYSFWLKEFIIKNQMFDNIVKFETKLEKWYFTFLKEDLTLFSKKEIFLLIKLYREASKKAFFTFYFSVFMIFLYYYCIQCKSAFKNYQ
jgi:glycosyltransferase involved in cell wall biosynthesis